MSVYPFCLECEYFRGAITELTSIYYHCDAFDEIPEERLKDINLRKVPCKDNIKFKQRDKNKKNIIPFSKSTRH